jgi:diguanylate cyclase (GGDEF)-like protein/PAS domain S-box-containing protein
VYHLNLKLNKLSIVLKESEFRWKFAIEGSGDGVWDWNVETDEALYSKHWKEMLGYGDTDILPKNDEWSSRIHPDDQLYVKNAMQAYLEGKTEIYVVEYRLRCKDDSYKWILGRGMIVSRSEDGKPLRMIGTHTDISERKCLELELTRQAHLDYLTSLSNRRHFIAQGEVELSRATRYDTPLSLLMLDIDFFKNVNDTYGHQAGDIVLQALSKICQDTLRQVDIAGRIGGEEFAIILPEATTKDALEVAERLREVVAKTEVAIPAGLPIHFTVSVGVITLQDKNVNIDTLLNQADKALYEAKETGRNKVCVCSLS